MKFVSMEGRRKNKQPALSRAARLENLEQRTLLAGIPELSGEAGAWDRGEPGSD